MAWSDAGQRSEAMPVARTGCDFAVSNRPVVATPAPATCRWWYQSLTASGMIYDHVSFSFRFRLGLCLGAQASRLLLERARGPCSQGDQPVSCLGRTTECPYRVEGHALTLCAPTRSIRRLMKTAGICLGSGSEITFPL